MEILIAPKTQILCARAGKSEKLILTEFRKRKPEFLSLIFVRYLYLEIFLLFKGIIQRTIPYLGTFLTDLMMLDAAYPDFTEVRGTGHHHPPYYISHHIT